MAKALVIDQNLTSILQINEEEEKEDSGYDADVTGNKIPEGTNTSNSNTGARRGSRNNAATALKSKASELTLSFEGKVYVFQKINPEKVQAVLSILGGSDIPDGGQCPRCLNVSRRIASLVRFREKRKDRCYEKKFQNNAHKKVEQKMDKKNTKSPIELNETLQTGGNILMETDIGVSKDIERVVDHSSADTVLQNLPRKKAKDKASGKMKSPLGKGKKRDNTQLQPTGTDGQVGQVSVGATGTTSGPLMVSVPSSVPFYPARPWNLPHYSQGSIEQVEQATVTQSENDSTQCRIMSGGWSSPPSCPSEMLPPSVMGCPDTSDPNRLPFHTAGPSNLPQMPCIYPHVYTEGSNRLVDQTMLQDGAGSNNQSNQGFIGFLSQHSNPHRLSESSMPQDILEPPAP
ncbi:hypothetical protein MKX03_010070 [Papaver bracteatum]|nr:hypothetical protein MKX03_010070 [Papaver bracteatum]